MAQVNICERILSGHKFFEVRRLERFIDGSPSSRIDKEGILVVCATCGEVREIWETGELIIRTEGRTAEENIIPQNDQEKNTTSGR